MGQSVARPVLPRSEVPPKGVCPLLAMPDVLLQLVFQLLPVPQALCLARCHRVLLHASASPHAWIHSELTVHAPSILSLPPRFEDLPVRLEWRHPSNDASNDAPTRDLLEFAESCNLRALDTMHASCCYNQLFLWHRIYSHPAMQNLLEASVHLPGNGERIWPLLAQLPQMHTLSMLADGSLSTADSWSGIRSLPSLTCLRLWDPASCVRKVCFPSIGCCKLLRELDVHAKGSFADLFAALPQMDNTKQLQKLILHGLTPDEESSLQLYQSGFAELSSLRLLSLASCTRCNEVVVCVDRACSLETLLIQTKVDSPAQAVRSALEATCRALGKCPTLSAIVRVCSLPTKSARNKSHATLRSLHTGVKAIATFTTSGRLRVASVEGVEAEFELA